MQRYIEQLIDDFKEAQNHVPPDPKLGTENSYEEFEEKMFAIETAPDVTAKALFGISYEEIPPAEKLSKNQMRQIMEAMIEMLTAFNFYIELPQNVPLQLQYKLLRDFFSEDIHYMPGFTHHLDFCDGWCPDCEILEYCDVWQDSWTMEEIKAEQEKSKEK